MYTFLLILHLLICLSLVCVVLVQSGKGGGLAGGAFGGSAQTVFGGRGATDFFTKATMALGGAFFLTSLILALMSSGNIGGKRSLIQGEAKRSATAAPTPGTQPQTGQPSSAPSGIPAPVATPAKGTTPPGTPATGTPAPASGGGR